MPNFAISDMAPATLPIDLNTTFFEIETIEGGISVSRKIAGVNLSFPAAITIEDEGAPLATAADTLNFVGAGVIASGIGATKTITIPGSVAASLQTAYDTSPNILINVTPDPLLLTASVAGSMFEIRDTGAGLVMQVLDTGVIAGDPGFEGSGIDVGGVNYDSVLKASDIGGTNIAQFILHRHSSTLAPFIVASRSQGDTSAHVIVNDNDSLFQLWGVGWDGADYAVGATMQFRVDGVPGINDMPTEIVWATSPAGSATPVEGMRLRQDGQVEFEVNLTLLERAAAPADVAGRGQFWVRNDVPNVPMFTDDTGVDFQLNAGGAIPDPLILGSINLTSALLVATTGTPYTNVPINIGANLIGTQGMTQLARQNIQTKPSAFGFNSTLFININGAGTAGSDTFIGGLNSASLEVEFGVAVRMQHGLVSTVVFETDATGIRLPAGSMFSTEKAAAAGDVAGDGQWWVRNDTPNVPMFTDDTGTDFVLNAAGAIPDPLILGSINLTSALLVATTGTPYANVPINIGANLIGTQGMTQLARQNIQTKPSAFGFNSTLFININGAGTNGSDTFIGGLNSASIEVAFGVAVRMQHGLVSTVVFETAATGILLPAGSMFVTEKAAAAADVGGDGQFWVRNDTPNTPMFTGDTGIDYVLNFELYQGGAAKIRAADETANDIGMGAEVVDQAGTFRPVGMNVAPPETVVADMTFGLIDNGQMKVHDEATPRTWTVNQSTEVPIGAIYGIININGTGTIALTPGAGVAFEYWDGTQFLNSVAVRTLGEGQYTIYKRSDIEYVVNGPNIT